MSDLSEARTSRRQLLSRGLGFGSAFGAVMLAACGQSTIPATAPPPAGAPTQAPAAQATPTVISAPAAAAPAAKASAPVELQVINTLHSGAEQDKKVFPVGYGIFSEQNHGQITIKETILPEDAQYYVKMLTMIAGGTPLDAAYVHPAGGLPQFAAQKVIVPIDDYIKADPSINIEDFYPGPLTYYLYPQGQTAKRYGIPWYYGPAVITYNKKVFEKYGVQTPDQYEKDGNWTWETLLNVAQQLTKGSGADKTFGYDGITNALHWLNAVIWGYGGDLWDAAMDKTLLGDAPASDALDYYASFEYKYKVVPSAAELEGLAGGFLAGRTAMRFATKGNVPEIRDAVPQGKIDPGIAPLPKGPAGRFTRSGPISMTIMTASKYPEECWKLINFMTTKDFQDLQNAIGISIPIRKSLLNADFSKTLQPWEDMHIYTESSQLEKAPALATTHLDIQAAFGAEFDLVRLGQQTYQQAAAKFVPKIDALLQKAKTA
jgi:multiple sugar transport system substrate-binding protein